jgi:methylenetetrahydrofolate dehydrogenase (NADP+)/methenyltetrahydrofolate cyclohydrolase
MQILYGKPVAEQILSRVKADLASILTQNKAAPRLVVILVGDEPASCVYVKKKTEIAQSIGILSEVIHFSSTTNPEEVYSKIEELNHDSSVHGILLQRPLPQSFDRFDISTWIIPEKDVDCFHPTNLGRLMTGDSSKIVSCTPKGILYLLDYYKIKIDGALISVIGRSAIVGRPLCQILTNRNATVIQCHSKTKNLKNLTLQSDIVVVAAGVPEFFGPEFFGKKSVVIDVGIHRSSNGKLVGDCSSKLMTSEISALTPVPGGVGPLTIATLMENTLFCYKLRNGHS